MDDDFLIDRIKARLFKRNQNFLIAIAGETGSGKSYLALRLGERIDPDFSIRNLVFKPLAFMELLKRKHLKQGSTVVFDEAGVGMPSREWYTVQNKMLGYIMQTFRRMNLCVIFTVPNLSFIDVQLRNLFHMYLETESIDYKANECTAQVFYLKQRARSNDLIPYHPRVELPPKYCESGEIIRIKTWTLPLPSPALVRAYERKKNTFGDRLGDEVVDVLEDLEQKSQPGESMKSLIMKDLRSGMKTVNIAKKHDTSRSYVDQVKEIM